MSNSADLLADHFIKPKKTKNNKKDGNMSKEIKPKKDYSHFKDIVITALVVGIIAFITGTYFANANNARVEAKASQLVDVVSREDSKN